MTGEKMLKKLKEMSKEELSKELFVFKNDRCVSIFKVKNFVGKNCIILDE